MQTGENVFLDAHYTYCFQKLFCGFWKTCLLKKKPNKGTSSFRNFHSSNPGQIGGSTTLSLEAIHHPQLAGLAGSEGHHASSEAQDPALDNRMQEGTREQHLLSSLRELPRSETKKEVLGHTQGEPEDQRAESEEEKQPRRWRQGASHTVCFCVIPADVRVSQNRDLCSSHDGSTFRKCPNAAFFKLFSVHRNNL